MTRNIFTFSSIIIYACYAYLAAWQIYYFNQEIFLIPELKESPGIFSKYLPSLVLFLFAILLFGNVVLKQKKMLILNSLLTAAMLFMYDNPGALMMAMLVAVFGLIMAAFELKGND